MECGGFAAAVCRPGLPGRAATSTFEVSISASATALEHEYCCAWANGGAHVG